MGCSNYRLRVLSLPAPSPATILSRALSLSLSLSAFSAPAAAILMDYVLRLWCTSREIASTPVHLFGVLKGAEGGVLTDRVAPLEVTVALRRLCPVRVGRLRLPAGRAAEVFAWGGAGGVKRK